MSARVLGIVPVKSKSVGIKKKNFEKICGKTLVEWTLLQASRSNLNEILVVTDSEDLLEICKTHDILCSIVNTTGTINDSIIESGIVSSYDYFMLLQVTSPCRTTSNINDVLNMLPAECVVSGFESYAANLSFRGQDPLTIWPSSEPDRQEFESFFQLNGAIFLMETQCYLRCKTVIPKTGKQFYLMPASRSIDVDEPWQLDLCRQIIESSVSDYVVDWSPISDQKQHTLALQPENYALE